MARGRHELDAKTTQVKDDGIQHIHIGFAGVTATGTDLSQFERAPKKTATGDIKRIGQTEHGAIHDQIGACARRQAIVRAELRGYRE